MPDDKKPTHADSPPSEAFDTHEDTLTGGHRIFELPNGDRVFVPVAVIEAVEEDDDEPPAKDPWYAWLFKSKTGGTPPIAYAVYSFIMLVGSGTVSLGVKNVEQESVVSQTAFKTMIAEQETVHAAHIAKQAKLQKEVDSLLTKNAILEAELKAHKDTEAHPGAIKRMGAIETQVQVNLEVMRVYHK